GLLLGLLRLLLLVVSPEKSHTLFPPRRMRFHLSSKRPRKPVKLHGKDRYPTPNQGSLKPTTQRVVVRSNPRRRPACRSFARRSSRAPRGSRAPSHLAKARPSSKGLSTWGFVAVNPAKALSKPRPSSRARSGHARATARARFRASDARVASRRAASNRGCEPGLTACNVSINSAC